MSLTATHPRKLRCAVYIRVSTDEQVERARLREQQERLPQLARERGWTYTVIQDLGVSGRTIDGRPGMTQLLRLIVDDQLDVVLVIEQSRLTRDTTLEDLGRIIRACQEHSVAIATPERTYRPDDLDDFVMLGIQGVLSAAEVRRFAKRAQEGRDRIASEGRYTGGIVPYGYRVGDDAFFVIYEPEAAVVRNMYAWLIDERMTLYAIQRRLNELGITPPNQNERRPNTARERGKRTRRTSKRWQGFTVKRILSSSFYAGQRVYGKRTSKPRPLVSGTVPAIVTAERHQQAQLRLAEQRARHARGQRYDYLLKGKIRCAACGHAYSGAFDHTVQNGTVCRYACTGNGRANERGSSCDNPSVRADILEPLIWNDIRRFLKQPELVLRHFDRESEQHRATVERQREQEQALEARQIALETEIERWLDLYPKAVSGQTAGITVDDVDRRVAHLRSELNNVERNIARLAGWTQRLEARDARRLSLAQLLHRLGGRLDTATPAEKASIVHDLVQSIDVEAERDEAGRPVFHYKKRHRPDGSFWYAHRVPHVTVKVVYAFPDDFPANEDIQSLAHVHRFIVATSWNRAGNTARPPARAMLIAPSSSGCRSASSAGRANSGSSSRSRTPRCARLASPGRGPGPPPTIAATEALWCGARNGAVETSGRCGCSNPTTEWIRVTSIASSRRSGGRMLGSRRPSIVFPVPGGPASSRL
jgi:site-specific DNA recombinase